MKKNVSIQCRNLSLSHGNQVVLHDLNLDIEPGEFFALLGPSGSGKSTLLRIIAGLCPVPRGQVFVDGQDITQLPPWERDIGMVFHSHALWPHLSVWDNVAFGLVERRLDSRVVRAKVAAMLEMVGLADYASRKSAQLSGGQQQRVALARTLVIEPRVLLLDEPLSNLDKLLRVQMRQELLALQRRLGITTVFVTHDQEDAMTTADRMAVLHQGVLQQVGRPATLYDYPVNTYVAHFVGTMNSLRGRVRQRHGASVTLEVEGVGSLAFPVNPEAPHAEDMVATFRPHALRMDVADAVLDARFLWIPGTVVASEFFGGFSRYSVRVGAQTVEVDLPHFAGLSKFPSGCAVSLGLESSQVRVFAA